MIQSFVLLFSFALGATYFVKTSRGEDKRQEWRRVSRALWQKS